MIFCDSITEFINCYNKGVLSDSEIEEALKYCKDNGYSKSQTIGYLEFLRDSEKDSSSEFQNQKNSFVSDLSSSLY